MPLPFDLPGLKELREITTGDPRILVAIIAGLPDLEAKIIDLYYFQHKTMDEIGVEIGLAKQRVSEIHKRALSKHPDAAAN